MVQRIEVYFCFCIVCNDMAMKYTFPKTASAGAVEIYVTSAKEDGVVQVASGDIMNFLVVFPDPKMTPGKLILLFRTIACEVRKQAETNFV